MFVYHFNYLTKYNVMKQRQMLLKLTSSNYSSIFDWQYICYVWWTCFFYRQSVFLCVPNMFLFSTTKDKFEDTKGIFRSRKSKRDRQYNGQKIPINEIIRSRKSKRVRQYNGQNKKDKEWTTKHFTEQIKIDQHEQF